MATNDNSAMIVAGREHVVFCFDILTSYFSDEAVGTPTFDEAHCPLFVTWKKAPLGGRAHRLRGCIGTLEPQNLRKGLKDYALTSALRDHRFSPMSVVELPALHCTVSLLCCFERANHWADWQVGVHGLIISFEDPAQGCNRTGTFLPEVAAHEGWDRAQTLDALIRKAGYAGRPTDAVRESLSITRYQSTACSMSYDEYQTFRASAPSAELELLEASRPITVPA